MKKFAITFVVAALLFGSVGLRAQAPQQQVSIAHRIASGGVSTSYANTGGSGDRQSIITITQGASGVIGGAFPPVAWINGITNDQTDYWSNQTLDGTNTFLIFDFGSGHSPIINEIKYYQETSGGQGTWKFQGSPDASTWTDLGTTFTLGGVTTQTITAPSANTTGYRYYKLLGMSGSCNNGPYVFEIEFKIASY